MSCSSQSHRSGLKSVASKIPSKSLTEEIDQIDFGCVYDTLRSSFVIQRGKTKETLHRVHAACIPIANGLIKGLRTGKRKGRIGYIRHVPVTNWLVESNGVLKHALQRCGLTKVPGRNVSNKVSHVGKEVGKVGNVAHIPPVHDGSVCFQ